MPDPRDRCTVGLDALRIHLRAIWPAVPDSPYRPRSHWSGPVASDGDGQLICVGRLGLLGLASCALLSAMSASPPAPIPTIAFVCRSAPGRTSGSGTFRSSRSRRSAPGGRSDATKSRRPDWNCYGAIRPRPRRVSGSSSPGIPPAKQNEAHCARPEQGGHTRVSLGTSFLGRRASGRGDRRRVMRDRARNGPGRPGRVLCHVTPPNPPSQLAREARSAGRRRPGRG